MADTSSLILLNKAELMDIVSSAFFVCVTESVRQEIIYQEPVPSWFSRLKVDDRNNEADLDVVDLVTSDRGLALLSDDREVIMSGHLSGRCYLSAIVMVPLLVYHKLLSFNEGKQKMSVLCEIGYYSRFVVKTAEQFLLHSSTLPDWMKTVRLNPKISVF